MFSRLLLIFLLAPVGCKRIETSPDQQGETTPIVRLHLAAKKGDLEVIESLIAQGCGVDAREKDGHTPLYTAALYGQTTVAEFLVSKSADVNAKTLSGKTALHAASEGGYVDVAKLLIAAGADVNAGKEEGRTPLYERPTFNRRTIVEMLLANGAEIARGNTPENEELLRFAVGTGLRDLAEKLLSGGTDADTLDVQDDGMSSLGRAVVRADKEMAMLLITHGADVDRKDANGNTPLHYATSLNREVAELLLANGADVNAGNPLMLAVERGDKPIVELFLAHGADANVRGLDGNTALDEAILRGHADIAEILRAHRN